MKPYKIDLAVLLIFFARPKQLEKVFEKVRIARPSKLYLYQDGPRNMDDLEGINKCREIALNIDWQCEVHTLFQKKNHGCDPSCYYAIKWMFKTEDMGMVLEDDDVPSLSFFPFCKELLLKYKNDKRINMICGMNNTEVCEYTPYDYIFSTSGSICGWASWKRVIDTWDDTYKILDDEFNLKQLAQSIQTFLNAKKHIKNCKRHHSTGKAYYETILANSMYLNHRLNIVVAKNMISNIGVTADATHSVDDLRKMPKGIRRIFAMPLYEINRPIKHPPYIIDDVTFRKRIYRIMGKGHPLVLVYRKIASIALRFRYGDIKGLMHSLLIKLKRLKP